MCVLTRPPLIIVEPLVQFLDRHRLGEGPIDAGPIGEGHSNVTYLIRPRARPIWSCVAYRGRRYARARTRFTHTDASATVPELERLLGVSLAGEE